MNRFLDTPYRHLYLCVAISRAICKFRENYAFGCKMKKCLCATETINMIISGMKLEIEAISSFLRKMKKRWT